MINTLFRKLFIKNNKETKPRNFESESFQKIAKDQFLRLQGMGISIPVRR